MTMICFGKAHRFALFRALGDQKKKMPAFTHIQIFGQATTPCACKWFCHAHRHRYILFVTQFPVSRLSYAYMTHDECDYARTITAANTKIHVQKLSKARKSYLRGYVEFLNHPNLSFPKTCLKMLEHFCPLLYSFSPNKNNI